jgi:DNA-binding XRE family transcriptional regulator
MVIPTPDVTVDGPEGEVDYQVPAVIHDLLTRMLAPYRYDGVAATHALMADIDAKSGGRSAVMLRGQRGKWDMTQKTVAAAAGIQQSHLSAMECGRRKVGIRLAQRLGKVFKCDWRMLVSEHSLME